MAHSDSSSQDVQRAVRDFLSRAAAYPDHPRHVELIETHISCVFVTDELVYKLKKPVRFEFVDFSTLAAREAACRAEVQLNRRLAAEVYLAVLPITRGADGSLALAGQGETIDWVVQMRRLPIERCLDAEIRAGQVTAEHIADLAALLGNFYAQAVPVEIDPSEYRRQIEHHVRANRADLLASAADDQQLSVQRTHAAQLQFLLLHGDTFDQRVAQGRIIEGHGDLRPEHICLRRPPVVFDCLEFDVQLRRLDLADELSFLAMECDRLGAAALGQELLAQCLAHCGDAPSTALVNFYKSYRASVRAKVAALRGRQASDAARTTAQQDRQEYLRLAEQYGRQFAQPLLIVVSGLMGSGKSTLAAALAQYLGCDSLQTDAVRRELFGASAEATAFASGAYTAENRAQVYEVLLQHAAQRLATCETVILDGTFLTAELLERCAKLARDTAAGLLVVRCHCPEEIALQRIAARLATGTDLSEARPDLYATQRLHWEDVPAAIPHVAIDTTRELEQQRAAVVACLQQLACANDSLA